MSRYKIEAFGGTEGDGGAKCLVAAGHRVMIGVCLAKRVEKITDVAARPCLVRTPAYMPHKNILIPCKRFSEGKTRLANLLSANERYELCAFLLKRTLNVARGLTAGDRIWLVTADE